MARLHARCRSKCPSRLDWIKITNRCAMSMWVNQSLVVALAWWEMKSSKRLNKVKNIGLPFTSAIVAFDGLQRRAFRDSTGVSCSPLPLATSHSSQARHCTRSKRLLTPADGIAWPGCNAYHWEQIGQHSVPLYVIEPTCHKAQRDQSILPITTMNVHAT